VSLLNGCIAGEDDREPDETTGNDESAMAPSILTNYGFEEGIAGDHSRPANWKVTGEGMALRMPAAALAGGHWGLFVDNLEGSVSVFQDVKVKGDRPFRIAAYTRQVTPGAPVPVIQRLVLSFRDENHAVLQSAQCGDSCVHPMKPPANSAYGDEPT